MSIHLATQVWTRISVAALPCAGWLTDVPRPSPTTLELSSYKGPGLQEIGCLYSKPSMKFQQRPLAFVKIAAL